jgi:L-cystine transport system substrate-binding protein
MEIMKLKNVFGLFIVAGLALGLAGCGGANKTVDKSSGAAEGGPKVVKISQKQTYIQYDFVNYKGENQCI